MYFKLLNEKGAYKDSNGTNVNLISADVVAYTPNGINEGWIELLSIDAAKSFFGIVEIDSNEPIYKPSLNWDYPDWAYRVFVSIANERFFANYFPEFLVNLNIEPKNPKDILSIGSIIYLNIIEPEAYYLFSQLGIILEEKP